MSESPGNVGNDAGTADAKPRTFMVWTGKRHVFRVRAAEAYWLAAQVKLIGDDPAVNHAVRIVDPDTGKVVLDDLTTDDQGVVRAEVPENKEYHIELVEPDTPMEFPDADYGMGDSHAFLRCRFVDEAGNPIANQQVEAKFGDDDIPFVTDADGQIEAVAHLGAYELVIGDQTFYAHSVPAEDADRDEAVHVFVVRAEESEPDSAGDAEEADAPEPLPKYPTSEEGEEEIA